MGVQKAVVAVIGGLLIIGNELFGFAFGIDEGVITLIVSAAFAALTALGVYTVPNSVPEVTVEE